MTDDAVDPADLRRLRSRRAWAVDPAAGACDGGRHADVRMEPDEAPRCARCGATLSPDALRRAGIRPERT